MRLSNTQAVSRPTYYDRNAISKQLYSNGGAIAPHTETVRASYTVPAGKKAFFETAFLRALRAAAAAPVGQAYAAIYYTPSGSGAQLIAIAALFTNAVNDEKLLQLQQLGTLYAGDAVDVRDLDNSTGGSVAFLMHLKGSEFDL